MADFFKNKVVVVTGGTDGIGRALVEMLLDKGAKVATCARNHDKLYQLQSEHPSSYLHTMVADVSSENDCRRFMETTLKFYGSIDILINNAGISMRALFKEASIDVIKQVMDINFYGSVYCTKYALDSIIQQKGTIVGVSSIAGYRGLPGRSGYSASKFALQGWLEALRTELMDDGVNVMWVCPGFTTSNIRNAALNKNAESHGETPMDEEKMMPADECARHILKAIQKKKRTLVLTFTGKRTVFMQKFIPGLADKLVHKFFFKNGKLVK
ncbi:MAG TPA: SDR family oxidoreductase [Chitinophagaceae bacterium]|nr:SDR family oxidoreductase [Chitinophagaceae bacterium]MCB9055928.1 SDR family oxidoreductase [Chitinophagales bacterium]HPG11444.1 SDR family oxidoreductase [Chitinophagaceae bacterium]HRX93597.1 SDR family oxidoreductase [Chitinophagaceae bacterium]